MNPDKPQHPSVSVVMPTYNHAEFIGEAIESVLAQTCGDFELIVVDNHSEDDTESIVKGFGDPRIEYLKFANNGVIAASRNVAMKQARGEFIAFLDSDDTWTDDKLEVQLQHLTANPNIALVCGSMATRQDRKPVCITSAPPAPGLSGLRYNWLLDHSFIFCSSVMIRRNILDSVGAFDEEPEIVSSEDWDLWLRVAREHRLTLLGKQLGSYRVHANNVSIDSGKIQRIECVLQKHLAKGWITAARMSRSMSYLSFGLGWQCVEKAPADARRMFKDARKFAKASSRIFWLAVLGSALSFSPPLCRFIKRKSISKIVKRMVNLHKPANNSEE